jgi:hypothetical protein
LISGSHKEEGMMRKSFVSRLSLAASFVATFLLAATASSAFAGTLDQQQTEMNTNVGLFATQSPAQTFTAGITGGLDRADLMLCCKDGSPVEPLTVEIRNASGGEPGTSVLASASIPMSALGVDPAFVPATFATPAAVTAGTQYALVAYTEHATNDCCGWNYQSDTDPYSGGALFVSHEPIPALGNWANQGGDDDYAFKTYVTPPPPSTPSTPPTTAPTTKHKKKCKKKHKKRSAESAKKKKCKKKKH